MPRALALLVLVCSLPAAAYEVDLGTDAGQIGLGVRADASWIDDAYSTGFGGQIQLVMSPHWAVEGFLDARRMTLTEGVRWDGHAGGSVSWRPFEWRLRPHVTVGACGDLVSVADTSDVKVALLAGLGAAADVGPVELSLELRYMVHFGNERDVGIADRLGTESHVAVVLAVTGWAFDLW